jgi:thiamine-phosphate pyrophosphorylase
MVADPASSSPLDLRVYAVLDPARCRGRDPVALAAAAARGGATLLQLRDKTSDDDSLAGLGRAVREALSPWAVPLIINDRVAVAALIGAGGVHVGQEDTAPAEARRLLGPGRIVGVTVHRPHEADAVDPAIADYAGMGPVFATATKDLVDPPIGTDRLQGLILHLRRRVPGFPVCGIAGIDHTNAASVIAAGADGVAVIADIFMADDVEEATRRLRTAVDDARARRIAA